MVAIFGGHKDSTKNKIGLFFPFESAGPGMVSNKINLC